jgi:hypothetical protein
MSDLIEAIIKTRKTAADIFVKSLVNIDKLSEIEIAEKLISEIKNHSEIFPEGWYSPPPSGTCVLLDQKPFKRLQFETLRKPVAWPNETSKFENETVGILYISPVDRKTGMFGDIGFTIYNGNDKEIMEHIRKCYSIILSIAQRTRVGMKFSDLYKLADNIFKSDLKVIGWMTTINDPTLGVNLGHTIPGSFDNNLIFGNIFDEVRNTITKNRIYINGTENFTIPATCAFTVEARLADSNKIELPNVFFHFIVCFDKGKKTILENFAEIFKAVGMDYMNSI